jgi:hypothetical protein
MSLLGRTSIAAVAAAIILAAGTILWGAYNGPASNMYSRVKRGLVLGYGGRLYRFSDEVPSSLVGRRLGTAVYHGNLGVAFKVYRLGSVPTSKAIVFQVTDGGPYWEAGVTSSTGP